MESSQVLQVKKYIDIIVRRKVLIIASILIGVSAGLAFYLMSSKIYEASTLLSYQQQSISPSAMSPDDNARIRDVVSTLTQIVTSRSSLEKIIADNNLYTEQQEKLPMEDIIQLMRRNINITPSREGDTFVISFMGNNPDQVVRVANALSAGFIEENLKYREYRASETSAYTEDELEMSKVMLDEKEAVMRDYKLQYYNEMPDQQESNVARLIALQQQYQGRQDSIQDLERTRVLIQDQIANRRQLLEEVATQKARILRNYNSERASLVGNQEDDLTRLYANLEALQDRYTEKHPEIRRLKKEIARLEKSSTEKAGTSGNRVDSNDSEMLQHDSVIADLQIQLKDIKLSIKNLNKEKEQLQNLIDQYEKWVAAAPVRESEWSALTREYGELRRHYDFLVSQNLSARSALNLERRQKGSQFKVEDSAVRPGKPIKPDFLKIIGMALLLGAGVGGCMALGLDLVKSSFRDPEELAQAFDIEVICAVPYVPLKRELRRERIMTVLGSFVFLICFSGIGYAFVYFWKQGQIVL
jgi:polysaccharide chain length determinant protein (PEP-CTERM system associated)